jgi:hypothetical protein
LSPENSRLRLGAPDVGVHLDRCAALLVELLELPAQFGDVGVQVDHGGAPLRKELLGLGLGELVVQLGRQLHRPRVLDLASDDRGVVRVLQDGVPLERVFALDPGPDPPLVGRGVVFQPDLDERPRDPKTVLLGHRAPPTRTRSSERAG